MPRNLVALATDANYSKYLEVMLYQLSVHSPWKDVCILVDGPADLGNQLKNRAVEFGLNPEVILVKDILDAYPKMAAREHVSRATFARLFLVELLPEAVEKILYLDLDILICRSISELTEFDLKLPIAAVGHESNSGKELFGHSDVKYFNAGVLLIDCEQWRENNVAEKFISILQSGAKLKFQDQDLLNLVFKDNWQTLPSTVNVDARSLVRPDTLNPMIVHFIGPQKPWLFNQNKFFDLWRDAARLAEVDLDSTVLTKAKFRSVILLRKLRKFTLKFLSSVLPKSLKVAIKKRLRHFG